MSRVLYLEGSGIDQMIERFLKLIILGTVGRLWHGDIDINALLIHRVTGFDGIVFTWDGLSTMMLKHWQNIKKNLDSIISNLPTLKVDAFRGMYSMCKTIDLSSDWYDTNNWYGTNRVNLLLMHERAGALSLQPCQFVSIPRGHMS